MNILKVKLKTNILLLKILMVSILWKIITTHMMVVKALMMKKVFVKMMVMMILKFYLMYNSIFHLVDLFAKIDRSDEQKCEPFFLKDERKND